MQVLSPQGRLQALDHVARKILKYALLPRWDPVLALFAERQSLSCIRSVGGLGLAWTVFYQVVILLIVEDNHQAR